MIPRIFADDDQQAYYETCVRRATESIKFIAMLLQSAADVPGSKIAPLYLMQATRLCDDRVLRGSLVMLLCERKGGEGALCR